MKPKPSREAAVVERLESGQFAPGNKAGQVGDAVADGHLHVRVPLAKKGRWNQAARAKGVSLAQWVTETLDRALES